MINIIQRIGWKCPLHFSTFSTNVQTSINKLKKQLLSQNYASNSAILDLP